MAEHHLLLWTEHHRQLVRLDRGVELRLGAAGDNDLQLPHRGVSNRHAVVRWEGRYPVIDDLGSKNGLFVAGEAAESVELRPGMVVQLGSVFLELCSAPEAGQGEAGGMGATADRQPSTESVSGEDVPGPHAAGGGEQRTESGEVPSAALDALRLPPGMILGDSAAMRGLLDQMAATVYSALDVLLLGETGTGKELFARLIHDNGPTSGGTFVAINCAAIPTDLLEAELFGVETRVATGVDPRRGLFEAAQGGTLLLDEIAEMPLTLQAKLLRVIQEREVLSLGGRKARKVDLRVVSASNANVPRMAREGRFRADLYYRLRGLQFHIPPLRERREDIPPLVEAFVERAAGKYGKRIGGISTRALELLCGYAWPGNVRELETEVERAVLLGPDGGTLESGHFAPIQWATEHGGISGEFGRWPGEDAALREPSTMPAEKAIVTGEQARPGGNRRDGSSSDSRPLGERVDELERRAILRALEKARGNKSAAARQLGVTRNGLALKMKRLGIPF